ncbi:MAG: hypothetical protein AAF573_09325 [Bacteroidota bacterium]
MIYTDEYNIYNKLEQWGYEHKPVCHSSGEYAQDEDEDGFFELIFNTRRRGKAVLSDLFKTILAPDNRDLEDIYLTT